jgi:predicted amino acid-binding ACT domain protein
MSASSRLHRAFVPGPGLAWTWAARHPRRPVCRASASVETASSTPVTVSVDNSREGGRSVIRLTGEDKPFLLRGLTAAVEEAGFRPTRINVLEMAPDEPVTGEFFLDASITDADVEALRAKVASVWADAPAHAPVAEDGASGRKLVPYEMGEAKRLPVEAVESGVFFYVDPFAHADWTTLTIICPTEKGIAREVMSVLAEEKLNIIFATIRSVTASDSGVAPDIYLLQTVARQPLGEGARVRLNNCIVDVLLA